MVAKEKPQARKKYGWSENVDVNMKLVNQLVEAGYDNDGFGRELIEEQIEIEAMVKEFGKRTSAVLAELESNKKAAEDALKKTLANRATENFEDFFELLRRNTRDFRQGPVNSKEMRTRGESEIIEVLVTTADMMTLLDYWKVVKDGFSYYRSDTDYENSKTFRFKDHIGQSIELVVIKDETEGYVKFLKNCKSSK